MTAGRFLKMLYKYPVYKSSAHRAYSRHRLGGCFRGNPDTEAFRNLRYQSNNHRGTFSGKTFFSDIFCGF